MKRKLVTVIVPVKNEVRKIGRLLRGLIGQTYRPLEIIIVDGGSTDGTRELVASYARTHSSHDLIIRSLNEGDYGKLRSPANARNIGVLNAQGKYVVFFDADYDLSNDVDAIKKIVETFESFEGCAHVAITYEPSMHTWIEKHTTLDKIILYFKVRKPLHIVCAFRAELIRNNLFDPTLGFQEDVELLQRLKTRPLVVDTNMRRCYPHTFSEKLRQAFWYGRTWRRYYKKVHRSWIKDFIRSNAVLGMVTLSMLLSTVSYILGLITLACAFGLIAYRWLFRDYKNRSILRKYRATLLGRLSWYLFRETVLRLTFDLGFLKSIFQRST